MGILAANGVGLKGFWNSLLANRSGIGRISSFDVSDLPYQLAGEITGFNAAEVLGREYRPRRMGRFTQFALATALMARDDAGLTPEYLEHFARLPVVVGVSTSDMDMVSKRPTPFTTAAAIPNAAASTVGFALHPSPELVTLSDACASGLAAINAATRRIMAGRYDIAFAGASESSLTPYTVNSLIRCGVCVPTEFPPEKASRPFDRDRTSGIVAEGAGMVVLENEEHARARGARIYAAVAGFGTSTDPRGETDGYGMGLSMDMALANAGRSPRHIDYVNAHAPSDPRLDATETNMVKRVFGSRAYEIPVGSIKGATGCPLGAAGVHQVITAALAIHRKTIPPTTNFELGDAECDLDYVPGKPRRAKVGGAIVNSHGYGRSNATMVLEQAS